MVKSQTELEKMLPELNAAQHKWLRQFIADVIGEDEPDCTLSKCQERRRLRAEQRKRARL